MKKVYLYPKGSHSRQSQFELFPGEPQRSALKTSSSLPPDSVGTGQGSRFFSPRLTLSSENFIVLGVVIIISMVIAFSLGVDRGKSTALPNRQAVAEKSQPGQKIKVSSSPALDSAIKDRISAAGSVIPPFAGVILGAGEAEASTTILFPDPESSGRAQVDKAIEKSMDKLYTVQVASFRREELAQQEAMDLKQKKYLCPSGCEIFVLPKGKYSIVCVGKFSRLDEAKLFSGKLKKRYKDCLIRSL